ncbi:MAG: Gfo/Idh/MocA family oxidoreductase [Kiritimatiellae bacterium]|nr:Gfo/Idh/MocA family oxidoreductase [Kiritimatiellia bacterium]
MTDVRRGGMIGAGAWCERQLNAWAAVDGAQIVALCDRHPERRDPIAAQFGIAEAFDDFEQMLDVAELDFVDICVRPYSHAVLCRLAAERGLPILCQKPFCTSMTEALEVVSFCKARGVRLMVNENFRWEDWCRKVKEILDSHVLGAPVLARYHARGRFAVGGKVPRQAYLLDMPRLVGYEMGVHYFDSLRYFFGEPESVYARMQRVNPCVKGEDVVLAVLGYEGFTCTLDISWASFPIPGLDHRTERGRGIPELLEVYGTDGTLAVRPSGEIEVITPSGRSTCDVSPETLTRALAVAQQHFVDCLASGAEFETSGEETLKTMALVWGAYLSAEEGRVVAPSELQGAPVGC